MQLAPFRPVHLIRSFVRREGRLTVGQQRALDELWPLFGVEPAGLIDLDVIFGRRAPRILEIGFGNGNTLIHLAQANPDTDYLGIEVHRPGVGHLLLEIKLWEVANLRLIKEDAVQVFSNNIPDAGLDQILVLFPDPWPKQRHHKRRLVQPEFIELMAAKLKAGGTIQMATDWESYAQYMLRVMNGSNSFRNLAGTGNFAERPTVLPVTRFEHRGKRLGHNIWNLYYQRI